MSEFARFVPRDQYFIHFNSISALFEAADLSSKWGANLLRMFTVRAEDNQLRAKLEKQLLLKRDPLTRLFAEGVVGEVAVTGGDFFVMEGADVTLIFKLRNRPAFMAAADTWLENARAGRNDIIVQEFNYRGHRVSARYTQDR